QSAMSRSAHDFAGASFVRLFVVTSVQPPRLNYVQFRHMRSPCVPSEVCALTIAQLTSYLGISPLSRRHRQRLRNLRIVARFFLSFSSRTAPYVTPYFCALNLRIRSGVVLEMTHRNYYSA